MRTRRIGSALLLTLAAGVSPAAGQQLPAPESGEPIVNVTYANGQVTMRDAADNTPLVMPRGLSLFDDRNIPSAVKPSVEVNAQPSGYDVVYTFRNEGSTPRPLANLSTGIITLGRHVTYQDMRWTCGPESYDVENHRVRTFGYPRQVYSPVTVLRNANYAVGVSLQYPILDYKHDCRISLRAPGGRLARGDGGRGFEVVHMLSNSSAPGGNENGNPASLNPGESRTYVVSVRVTKTSDEWIRTLVPYRNFFRSTYGGVTYTRDTTPINGTPMALPERVSRDNPAGFLGGAARPDLEGYGDWVQRILSRRGWKSYMLWGAAGMYSRGEMNYRWPYQVATRLVNNPRLSVSATDNNGGIASIARPGRQLGIWFFRSVEVARAWDATEREAFDPDNPEHVRLFLDEVNAAVALGATMIGLDTFTPDVTPIWKLHPWLKRLRTEYPQIRFGIEPITCDILHALAPTKLRGNNDRGGVAPSSLEELYIIKNPHYLADFLLPGHEIWGGFRYGAYKAFNATVTPAIVDRDMRELASYGYVPLIMGDVDQPGTYTVAESWKTTVPADLQIAEGGKKENPTGQGPGNGAPGDPTRSGAPEAADPSTGPRVEGKSPGGVKPEKPRNSGGNRVFSREEAREAMRRYRETVQAQTNR